MIRALAATRRAAPVACGIAAFLVPAFVYIGSASHEPGSWDTAELQGVPYILGITHPTGFPFYVLLGYAWSHLVAIDSIAFRMNAMSGLAIAGAVAAAYAIALEMGARRAVALPAALWFAFAPDVWLHANRAESQDVAVLCEAIAVYAFLRWMKGSDGRWYATAFALFGLGMAAHPNAIWLAPAFAVGGFVARRRPSLRLALGSLTLTALGLAFYLYLPLRSAYIVAHGLDPTLGLAGTDGGMFWNYHNPSTRQGLLLDLSGGESNVPHYFLSSFNPVHVQDALWALIQGLGEQFGAFVLVLSAVGLCFAWRRDRSTTLVLFIACTAALLFSVTYSDESDVGRYRILALLLAVPMIGSIPFPAGGDFRAMVARAALVLFLIVGAVQAFSTSLQFFHHDRGEGGRWVIGAVRPYVPRGGIILANWLDATSLAYGAYADGSLAGRIIVSGAAEDNVGNYPVWARSHRVFILVDPHDDPSVPFAKLVVTIDPYHALWKARAH